MEVLIIITSVFALTQIIRVIQNAIDLKKRAVFDKQNKEVTETYKKIGQYLEMEKTNWVDKLTRTEKEDITKKIRLSCPADYIKEKDAPDSECCGKMPDEYTCLKCWMGVKK